MPIFNPSPPTTFVTPRVYSVADAATITPDISLYDAVDITAIAQAFTIANPTGTPANFQKLTIRIKDNGVPRTIVFGTSYVQMGIALPTITILSKILTLGFCYDSVSSKWGLLALQTEI